MLNIRLDQFIALILFSILLVLFPPARSQAQGSSLISKQPELISPATVPIYRGGISGDSEIASLSASAIYVMDRDSGAVLYQKNAHSVRYPASTAKMMTALVARQAYSLDQVLTVGDAVFATGTVVGFQFGEKLSVESLLKALLIPSGNDAALVLGQHHPYGYQGFITQMNQMANTFHLTSTIFNNVSGLDADNERSSARDLAILANQLVKDPVLRDIVATPQTQITDESGEITHFLKNTQELFGQVPGIVGIKTGTTNFAGENLITGVTRGQHRIIIVVLGSTDRFTETKQLINWVFTHYQWQSIGEN